LVTLLKRYHFAADYDFINNVRELTRYRDFDFYYQDFSRHPKHCGFARRVLRLRVSSKRLRFIIRDTMVNEKTNRKPKSSGIIDHVLISGDADSKMPRPVDQA
jgi:hypothetical protein